jgi:L-threonylcarbamoyladenylate synthase
LREFSCPAEAANWLKKGKILIHPTEGIWGMGCDALNASACKKINFLKHRDQEKKFILLSPSIQIALEFFQPLTHDQASFLNKIWPGHTTVIHYAKKNVVKHLKASDNTIAIRVCAHIQVLNLLNELSSLMVSTSANISNSPTPTSLVDIYQSFKDPDVAVYAHTNGLEKKSSAIVRLESMEYTRE